MFAIRHLQHSSIELAPLDRQLFVKSFGVFLLIILASATYWYFHRPITYPPGILVASDPEQTGVDGGDKPFDYRAFHLQPLAHFTLNARVLHRKVYRYDRQAELVPVDLALGWGPMSDQRVLDRMKITQSMRFYWFEYKMPPPIPNEKVISHSTNVHVIPATSAIASRCKSLRAGSLVHLSGELVEATGPGVGTWRSSLSRTDTGNGACELMWVTDMSIVGQGLAQDRHLASKR